MPTISIKCNLLFEALGRTFTEDEFAELCFDYGLELDEVTTERQLLSREFSSDEHNSQSSETTTASSSSSKAGLDEPVYRVEIPANRYDLLCLEGLARALNIFLKASGNNKTGSDGGDSALVPRFNALPSNPAISLAVTSATKTIRPYVAAAILHGVHLDQARYDSFIELQDKLHQNLCRKRTLASIGTHDLDTLQGPFTYTALPPKDISFRPLNQNKEMTAEQLMDFYSHDSHLKAYLHIIRELPLYPVLYDKNNTVLSLPPIVNGDHSKITPKTRNIFIEVTGTDEHKVRIVLDTMLTMFCQLCSPQPFVAHEVQIQNPLQPSIPPILAYRNQLVDIKEINHTLGTKLSTDKIQLMLLKMGIKSEVDKKKSEQLVCEIPPTRHDILHPRDLCEEVGIAFGYNNIDQLMPQVATVGKQLQINKLTDQLRGELARCGYTEALTFSLCSREDISSKMLLSFDEQRPVEIGNPKTLDFQVCRTSLIPGLLKTASSNNHLPLPLRLFEISEVVFRDDKTETGARNQRRLCALNYNKTAGFELLHGLLDRIMQVLEIPYSSQKSNTGYYIYKLDYPSFLPKRGAQVIVNGQMKGKLGVLHPKVILNFELTQPCAILELDIEDL